MYGIKSACVSFMAGFQLDSDETQTFVYACLAGVAVNELVGTTMIVSRGIGNSIIPLRINNRPEIVIIELNCG